MAFVMMHLVSDLQLLEIQRFLVEKFEHSRVISSKPPAEIPCSEASEIVCRYSGPFLRAIACDVP
ncbi:hypothetical protein IC582_020237 [Cucumis melo]